MEKLQVSQLPKGKARLQYYHRSGVALITVGQMIDRHLIECLGRGNIKELLTLGPFDNPGEYVRSCQYSKRAVDSLVIGEKTSAAVYDKSGTLLLDAGVVITEKTPGTFKSRGFTQIFFKRNRKDLGMDEVQTFREALIGLDDIEEGEVDPQSLDHKKITIEIPQQRILTNNRLFTNQGIDSEPIEEIKTDGQALKDLARPLDPLRLRSQTEKTEYLNSHEQTVKSMHNVFTQIERSNIIQPDALASVTNQLIGMFLHDKNLLLNLVNEQYEGNSMLLNHSLNVGLVSMNIGAALNYSKEQVLELAYGAFLHNIGMLQLPRKLLGKEGRLSQGERLAVRKHSIYGINLLQKLKGVPMSTPFVAYQAHERMDGSGYPKGRKGNFIHPYARIVAIADNFCALTENRPYRKGMIPYQAMEAVVRMCSRGQLDGDIVRSFLAHTSLFPIGSWLELSNGNLAKVVVANPTDFTRPVISVIYENKKRIDEPYRIDLFENKDISITRAFDGRPLEKNVMDGF